SLGWRASGCVLPLSACQHLGDRFWLPLPCAHLQQGTDDSTHHAVQKAVCGNQQGSLFVIGVELPASMGDMAVIVVADRLTFGKAAAVVPSQQAACSLFHGCPV